MLCFFAKADNSFSASEYSTPPPATINGCCDFLIFSAAFSISLWIRMYLSNVHEFFLQKISQDNQKLHLEHPVTLILLLDHILLDLT